MLRVGVSFPRSAHSSPRWPPAFDRGRCAVYDSATFLSILAQALRMTWKLPSCDHHVYRRNPIRTVVIQLRFHPILKVGDGVPNFQEAVRHLFPSFSEGKARHVNLDIQGSGFRVQEERFYEFSTVDGSAALKLSQGALAFEVKRHQHKEELCSRFGVACSALASAFSNISPTRLGLRYINVLDRQQIESELGRQVSWGELISDGFLPIPNDLLDLNETLFGSEISSALEPGTLTLRYGLLREAPSEMQPKFRFDVDRYMEAPLDFTRVGEQVAMFAEDIYRLYQTAILEPVREWMRNEGEADAR